MYRYEGVSLPKAGDIITVTKASKDAEQREEMLAYVTWVDPKSDTPIRVTDALGVTDPWSALPAVSPGSGA